MSIAFTKKMQKITFRQRIRYWFDNTMSKGAVSLLLWLAVASALLIVGASLLVKFGLKPEWAEGQDFAHIVWQNLMRTIDAGTMGGDSGSWGALFLMLAVTTGGIFVFSALIGVLNSGLEAKLDELRKGRSFVVEKDHTVIYGWSPLIFPILAEIAEANRSRKRPVIAILADRDKVEMEDEIRARVENLYQTRIVCRSGSPIDFKDVQIVNPNDARSILVLAPDDVEDPDSHVIKTTLAILNNPDRKKSTYHITAELRSHRNQSILKRVAKDEVESVVFDDLITRISVQTCRQTGLSVVLTDLLNFSGHEIYFAPAGALAGSAMGAALLAYEQAAVLGVRRAGKAYVLPPSDWVIQPDDAMILIAEDDSKIRQSGSAHIHEEAILSMEKRPNPTERTLILGWNERAESTIWELDAYVEAGSEVTLVSRSAVTLERQPVRQTLHLVQGDVLRPDFLASLHPESYDRILVLREDGLGVQEADARTLIVLLHLREIADHLGQNFSIVSEMGDIRNQRLAETTQVDDFIVSDRLVSLIMAQISENKALAQVFEELFDPEGAELYLKPASDYIREGQSVSFYTVIEAARRRGEIAIGWLSNKEVLLSDKGFGVHLNPPKNLPVTFSPTDRIVVLAHE